MASNAQFKIDIYGDTTRFENSLKGINSAMSSLKGEASLLKRELKLDPTNTEKMVKLQQNLQQQMKLTTDRSAKLKQEISQIDKTTPDGQKKFLKLSKDLQDNAIKAGYLERDIKEVDEAIARGSWKVDVDTNKAESSVKRLGKGFSAMKEIAIGALRRIGENIVSSVSGKFGEWIDDTKATQKAMISLKNTMNFSGVGKDFASLSKRMAQVAKDTNANTEDTLKLASTFTGLGDSAKTAGDKVENIVKANQAFGGTGEQLKGVVQAYGQMSASGKVTAENINQLTDNNTALGAALKKTVMDMNPALKQYGSFAQASEKGAVSVEMLDNAMGKLGKAGGGGVETIDDAMASLNETISLSLLPILDAVTPAITKIINAIADNVPNVVGHISDLVSWFQFLFEAIGNSDTVGLLTQSWLNLNYIFGRVMEVIKSLLESFGLLSKDAGNSKESYEVLADVIENLVRKISKAIEKLAVFVSKMTDSQAKVDILKGAIVALGTAFAVFKGITFITSLVAGFGKFLIVLGTVIEWVTTFGSTIAGLLTPVGWVIAGVATLVAGLTYFFTKTETGKKVWATFVSFLSKTTDSVVKFFQDSWKNITTTTGNVVQSIKGFFSGLGTWFSNLWQSITETTTNAWNGVVSFFSGIVEGIKGFFTGLGTWFSELWTSIVETTTTIWETMKQIFINFVTWVNTTFAPLINFFQALWNLVTAIVNLAWQVIIGIIRMVYNNIVNLWTGIINFFRGLWNTISNVASSAWNAIANFASGAWNRVVGVWNKITGWFSGVWNSAKNIASSAWNAIVNFASSAWSRVVGVWNSIASWFGGVFNSVASVVSNAFNRVASFASSAYSRVVGVFSSIGGWFAGVFNSVASVVANVFNQFYGFASNAFRNIVNVFNGIVGFFSNIFNSVADIVNSVLGGVTDTINNIANAVNGVAGKVKGFFGGSIVAELRTVSLGAQGMLMHSADNQTSNVTNTFHISAGQMDVTSLARAIKQEYATGRA